MYLLHPLHTVWVLQSFFLGHIWDLFLLLAPSRLLLLGLWWRPDARVERHPGQELSVQLRWRFLQPSQPWRTPPCFRGIVARNIAWPLGVPQAGGGLTPGPVHARYDQQPYVGAQVCLVHTHGNLSVTLNSQLPLTANIPTTTCSCRLMLHNIRRMLPFLTQGGEGSSRFWSRLWSSHTCVFILLAFYIWTSRPHYLV